jgi:hypothetical protein
MPATAGGEAMADEEHVKRLKQGVEKWNAWRQDNLTIRPNLSGADLRDANLGSAVLEGADLSGADLSVANLALADLTNADLGGEGPTVHPAGAAPRPSGPVNRAAHALIPPFRRMN